MISITFFHSRHPNKHLYWWRRLEDVFRLHLQKTSSRRLDQDGYGGLSLTSLEDVLVKINIFILAIRLQDVLKTCSRRLQDILSRRLQDVLQKRLQDVLKTSSRRLQDIFKTSSKRFQDFFKKSSRRLQDSGCFWGLTHVFQEVQDKNLCDCLQHIPDLVEKSICCPKNPETATVRVLKKKTYSFIKKGSSIARLF